MEMKFDKKTLRNIAIIAAVLIVLYWLLNEPALVSNLTSSVEGIFLPFFVGSVLAFILNVPMRAIEGRLSGIKHKVARRSIALLLTLLGVVLVLSLVFVLLIPELSDTIQSLIPRLITFFEDMEKWINSVLVSNPQIMEWISEYTSGESINWSAVIQNTLNIVGSNVSNIFSTAISAIGSITSALISAFIAVAFAIYSLFQKETLARQGRKVLYALFPERICDKIVHILRLSNSTFSNFLSGQCVEVCILGSMFAITMAIFRMPYIPLISVLVAVTAFIPVVGAWTGCIIGAFLIFVANPLQAVWFVVMFLILQQIENNLIYPRVVGTSIGLPGMWVLLAVALGGEVMGVFGMFLMIPVVSVVYTLMREFINGRLQTVNVPQEKLTPQPPELRSRFKEERQRRKEKKDKSKKAEDSSAKDDAHN